MAPRPAEETAGFNQKSLKHNHLVVNYFRVFCSLFTGAACGIIGVQGLSGFAVYFIQHALMTLPLALKAGIHPKTYFPAGFFDLLMGQIFASETFMTFLLLWTVLFNIGHIF